MDRSHINANEGDKMHVEELYTIGGKNDTEGPQIVD